MRRAFPSRRRTAAVATLAAALTIVPVAAWASSSGPSKAELLSVVKAENGVIKLANHYAPGASWASF